MQTIINAIRYVYLRLRYGYGPGDRVITRRLKGDPPIVVGFLDGLCVQTHKLRDPYSAT